VTRTPIAAVITCRDLGRSLEAALASVERQTRPAAEIVVVDDLSADIFTRQVLDRLERNGTRVVRADGRGVSAARNLGARLTSSEYLMWLDADDVLELGYFEAAAACLDSDQSIDFVSCAMRAFGAATYVWTPAHPSFVESVSTGGVPHASTVLRRRLWEAVGGFDEALPSFELLDFWASALERGFRGVVLSEPLLNYCVRPGSGYRRSLLPDTYRARLSHFYAKHRAAVEAHGPELVRGKEAFLIGQREYGRTLEARASSLGAELADLNRQIGEVSRALEALGEPRVDLGDLRRMQPVSDCWGHDRGTPVDRHYIETFLSRHRGDIRGRVLEVRDSRYTQRFGGDAVTKCDVLDLDPTNDTATIKADLRHLDAIARATYDCVILTQTLQFIDDIPAALAESARVLRPGGVLLATAPSIVRVDDERGPDGDYWRLTEASARTLFAAAFPIPSFEVTVYGNVASATAFLYGLSAEELGPDCLAHQDSTFPVIVAIRAVKPDDSARPRPVFVSDDSCRAVVLAYHRVAELTPDTHALCTPPAVFREQMQYLHEAFLPIGLEDLVRAAALGRLPERAVAVTLDDGYLDALTEASPILEEWGIPATFFVNTDRLDEEHERWWDLIEELFLSGVPLPPRLVLRTASRDELRTSTGTAAERAAALEAVNRLAWPLDAAGRLELVRDVLAWGDARPSRRETHRVLTAAEVKTLAERPGHTIGAHSVHHLALPTQPLETKCREIVEDKTRLEGLLARPVHLFAYPYGDYDAETVTVVSQAGFRAAVTVQPGRVSAGTNRLLLPRIEMTPDRCGRFETLLRQSFEGGYPD
jgi:peptidoglycan/xylan/chitin deacetylase (PgdA/CDA1 family)